MNSQTGQPAQLDDRAAYTTPAPPRPLLLPTLAFMAGIVLSEFLGIGSAAVRSAAFLLPIVAAVPLLLLAARRNATSHLLHALIILAALGVGFARHQSALRLEPNHVTHLATDEPILTRLAGRIVTQPTATPAEKRNPFLPNDPSPRVRFVLSASELRTTDTPVPITGLIRVSVEAERIEARFGDEVVVTGKLYRPRGPRNPGETDWARWNRLQNIHAGLAVEGAVHLRRIQPAGSGGHRVIAWLRGYTQSLLFEPFTQCESDQPLRLLDAMVLGHRSAAGRQLNEAFLRTGAIHFLTVSGFHVGVLAGVVWLVMRRVLRRGVRAAALVTMVVIAIYALIVEHNAPVLRAATMAILLCLAQLTRRPFCGLNWLAFSALCILTYNPLELFRAGFQLSFAQVLALFTIVPGVYRLVVHRHTDDEVPADADTWSHLIARWIWRWLAGLAIVCGCAWIVSLPLVLLHFGRFAPWGALQSIVVSPLVMVTIVLGFFTLIAQMVLPPLGAGLGFLLRGATDLLLWAVKHLSSLPATLVEVHPPPAGLVVATYALALSLLWTLLWRRGMAKILFAISVGAAIPCLWTGWLIWPATNPARDCVVHVLSVGSGTAVLVTTPDEHALLYDVGTIHNFDAGETVVRAARTLGIGRLDALALSHANFDHYSGAATVLSGVPTGQLLFNPYFEVSAAESPAVQQLFDSLSADLPPRSTLQAGDRFALGSASIEVMWPPDGLDDDWGPNDRSLVLRISANGRSVLLAGDIERDALRRLLDRHESGQIDLFSDVLIAPHHGSVVPGDTAAFYEAVSPLVVVNSTGRERPKLEALVRETLGDDVRLLSTHAAGAITVRLTSDGRIEIETPFASLPE